MESKEQISSEGTEGKIIDAAHNVFLDKGFDGTRMREIADMANINKGLLHYYFKSKDKLFAAVFGIAFQKIVGKINVVLESDQPLFQKIEAFVHTYITAVSQNPRLPRFVINELNRHPQLFIERVNLMQNRPHVNSFIRQVESEVAAGTIRPINPKHLFMHMISASVFPFIGKPLFQAILDIEEKEYIRLIEERKKEVTELIIRGIKV